ncbi:MAG: stage II sporulation protein R [Ruminococcaceae bacterium]|nr:stage II sporulation protein R [Oscillospiraceae bacterium]
MRNKNFKIIVSSILIGLIFSSYISLASFISSSENIRANVLRLHIKANSDSDFDQSLKLKVRDEILKVGDGLFSGVKTLDEAVEKSEKTGSVFEETARRVIKENGCDYPVRVEIGKSFFPVKTYENGVTLPAGDYTAVKILIGEGKGHNWWCVMFPPLCLPAAEGEKELSDVLDEDAFNLTKSNPKYEVRFKIAELFEKICSKAK